MTFTANDLLAIERAIASGELTVESNGQRVTYRSMDDLIKARDIISKSLGGKKRVSYISRRMD